MSARLFAAAALQRFMAAALIRAGLPEPDAGRVAGLMLEADLVGADAHGIFRLPQYVRRLEAGGVNTVPRIAVDRTGPTAGGAGRRRQRHGPPSDGPRGRHRGRAGP